MTFLLEGDGFDVVFGEHIASCGAALDSEFAEILDDFEFLEV